MTRASLVSLWNDVTSRLSRDVKYFSRLWRRWWRVLSFLRVFHHHHLCVWLTADTHCGPHSCVGSDSAGLIHWRGLSHYLFRTVEFAVSMRCFAHFPPRPRAVLHLMPAGRKFRVSWELSSNYTHFFNVIHLTFVYMWFHLTEDGCQDRSSDSLGDDARWKFSAIILSLTLGLWKSSGAIRSSIYTFLRNMTHCPDSDAGADSFPTQIPQYSIV